ncbi:hypothetical protein ACFU96_47420 [Streptomyces sp. NPDC057620]|uniref:hypothetical protein n=1 Tax=Streptomyces sp. NPDC057620 TaxID=3346185 RepID=UPI0036C35659
MSATSRLAAVSMTCHLSGAGQFLQPRLSDGSFINITLLSPPGPAPGVLIPEGV